MELSFKKAVLEESLRRMDPIRRKKYATLYRNISDELRKEEIKKIQKKRTQADMWLQFYHLLINDILPWMVLLLGVVSAVRVIMTVIVFAIRRFCKGVVNCG